MYGGSVRRRAIFAYSLISKPITDNLRIFLVIQSKRQNFVLAILVVTLIHAYTLRPIYNLAVLKFISVFLVPPDAVYVDVSDLCGPIGIRVESISVVGAPVYILISSVIFKTDGC